MALLRKKTRVSGEIPTSSMADIAFLLLIFFLVSTIFAEEKGLPIVLPEPQQQVKVSQQNVLHLTVMPNGLVDVKRGESPQVQTVRPTAVEGIWRREVSTNPDLIAAVKTHPQAAYKNMIAVLDELQAAGAERISLQILEQ